MEKEDPTRSNSVIAHATCMGFAFAFLMPVGAIVMRVAKVKGLIWYHAAIMMFAYTLALAGLGLGIYIAIKPESQVHPIVQCSCHELKQQYVLPWLTGAHYLDHSLQRTPHHWHNCGRPASYPATARALPPCHL